MKLGIVGLARSGKTTLFSALTGLSPENDAGGGKLLPVQGVVSVPDSRLEWLYETFKPKKKTPIQVTYMDLQGGHMMTEDRQKYVSVLLNHMRLMDALVMVVRNFDDPVMGKPDVERDFQNLHDEFILTDLATAEKRLSKIEEEKRKGKKISEKEYTLLKECVSILNSGEPLRNYPEVANAPELRGYTFLSGKPLMVVVNNSDDVSDSPDFDFHGVNYLPVRAKLEMELLQLDEEEMNVFKEDFGIRELARDLIIQKSFELLDLVTFYTINDDEARAWTVKGGTPVVKAAGVIHSDMERGFIRAEVIHFDDLHRAGNFVLAKKEGTLRLEGRDYIVQDGDVIQIRFGV